LTEQEFSKELVSLYPFLMPIAMKHTANRNKAMDLVQDTMLLAWTYRKSFIANEQNKIKNWAATIMRNRFISVHRHESVLRMLPIAEADGVFLDPPQDSKIELAETLEQFAKLPRRFQMVLVHNARGEPAKQAAHILNIPDGTQKSRLFRARNALNELCQ
jgi:RNA polymerase sigma-70 factor, ECF subfamily